MGNSCFRNSMIIALILFLPVWAFAENPMKDCGLRFVVEETEMLQDGTLVGELIFTNAGKEEVRIGGVMSIAIHTGQLRFELEGKDKKPKILTHITMADAMTVQGAALKPGSFTIHPVCLLKSRGDYFFSDLGQFRIRAIYGNRLKSNWVEIEIKSSSSGHEEYIASHQALMGSLYGAFDLPQGAEMIFQNLDQFGEYRREQEKLQIYQMLGSRVPRNILVAREEDQFIVAEAVEVRELARKLGLGQNMWESIVNELKEVPASKSHAVRVNRSGKYYF